MGFFDEDPFEDIVREFFGNKPRYRGNSSGIISGEEEDRVIDFVEDEGSVFLVFELPGYEEEDILVQVKDKKIKINASKKNVEVCQNYLCSKLKNGVKIEKVLPDFILLKNFKSTFKNGVLEVEFIKK